MKKFLIVSGIIAVVVITIITVYFFNIPSSKDILKNKGYTKEQVSAIIDIVTSIDDVLNRPYNDFLVNKEIDKLKLEYDSNIILFLKDDYYKKDNLNRYIKYKKNNDLGIKEVVKRVNSNIDYEFYTKTKSADLTKDNKILVNKYYFLGSYVPTNLVSIDISHGSGTLDKATYQAFTEMADEMNRQGLDIYIKSAYRSFDTQNRIYNNYKNDNGFAWAEKWSARPGYSEHQTGLAIDVAVKGNNSFDGFEYTKEYEWLKENCYKHGFVLRYTEENKYITGYNFEPWHYRYVGKDISSKIYELDLTYEEYYEYFIK